MQTASLFFIILKIASFHLAGMHSLAVLDQELPLPNKKKNLHGNKEAYNLLKA
jgi:hypothetical protein